MDVYSDTKLKNLYQILLNNQDLMPIVKEANLDAKQAASLPASAFAWPVMRQFRIDTPEHATLSWAYMEKQASKVPDFVKGNIENALAVFEVDVTSMNKTAEFAPSEDYLFPEERRYRVVDKGTYKLAHAAMLQHYSQIPWQKRTAACVKLAEKAMELEEDMHPALLRQAGLVSCDLTKLSMWIRQRAMLSEKTKPEMVEAFDTIADGLQKVSSCSREELVKLSSTLGTLDKVAGIDKYYGDKLPNPVSTVFNTDKFAEATVSMAGKFVPISSLMARDPEYFADALGSDVIPEITTNGELDPEKVQTVFRTLPMDMQKSVMENLGL
jgi:hypothetical protein